MPVYGVERYIAHALDSVLAQTFTDWELLVVNDGSTDRSRAIAEQYEKDDPRITILDKPNGGLSDARNFGVKHARGSYIHFFDSDDWIDPDYYENLISATQSTWPDIVVSGYVVAIERDGQVVDTSVRHCLQGSFVLPQGTTHLQFINGYVNYAWNKLFKASFLTTHSLEYAKGLYLVEDCEFMSRAVACSPKIVYTTAVGYHYIDRQRSTLSKVFDDNTLKFNAVRLSALEKLLGYYGATPAQAARELDDYKMALIQVSLSNLFYNSHVLDTSQYVSHVKKIFNSKELKTNHFPTYSFQASAISLLAKLKLYRAICFIYKHHKRKI